MLSWSSYFKRSLLFLYVQLFIVQKLCAYIIKELGVGERGWFIYIDDERLDDADGLVTAGCGRGRSRQAGRCVRRTGWMRRRRIICRRQLMILLVERWH